MNRISASSDWIELIVEGVPAAILMADRERRIALVNRHTEVLFGYCPGELVGQPLEVLLPQRLRAPHADHVAAFFATPRARLMGAGRELFGLRKDGVEVPIEIGLSPVETPDGSFTFASIVDITERKRSEDQLRHSNSELAQINAQLDDFVHTASHDLRAPLTGVSTVAQWILQDDTSLTPQTRERLILIQKRVERMKRLLNDIRDYARTGRLETESGESVSAASLVAEVAALADIPAGFSIRSDDSLRHVQVFRMPLEQVLHNLINNAIKHHDQEAGIVTVSVDASGPRLRFSVIDDGPGVPEPYRELIFEMFKTLKPRDQKEGSGMGLALVRKIVTKMGGNCAVKQVGERGAHFWFEWPKYGKLARESA